MGINRAAPLGTDPVTANENSTKTSELEQQVKLGTEEAAAIQPLPGTSRKTCSLSSGLSASTGCSGVWVPWSATPPSRDTGLGSLQPCQTQPWEPLG